MTHPLTDETSENIAPVPKWVIAIADSIFSHCDMRGVTDRQLEQVYKWIQDNTQKQDQDCEWDYILDDQIENLKEAMLHTTTQKDNNDQPSTD